MNLSIIIISYNTLEITEECLLRVKKAVQYCQMKMKNKIEVIVVDNASTDGSVQMIRQKHPWVKLFQSGENLGFGKGNNLGMSQSQGPFFLLLNSDCYIEEETLFKALHFYQTYPSCDVMGCKLTFKNGGFQPSAGFLPNVFNIIFWMLGLDNIPLLRHLVDTVHERDKAFFEKTRSVEWVQGAFLMLKKEVYQKTGGFDEQLFMYMEEVEWCYRIKKHKFKVFYTPFFKVIHLGGASSGFNLSVPLYKELEGLLFVVRKHLPKHLGFVKKVVFLGCFLRILAFSLLGKFNRVRAYQQVLKLLW